MKLYTEINIEPLEAKIDYKSRIFTTGSCFAQRMGLHFERMKFTCTQNPSGVLYNPLSIQRGFERYDKREFIASEELIESEGGFFHFDFHSCLNDFDREACARKINEAISTGTQAVQDADWVIITLGTAWVYRLMESKNIVANCHKRPAAEFVRERLGVQDCVKALESMIEGTLAQKNVIITLSPIRHMADGLVENSLSKATLRLAINEIVSNCRRAHYFPAYELMMDELRDYRFYERDMLHPSSVAVEYIWEKFCDFAISNEARAKMEKITKLARAYEHRPINPASEAHKAFCRSQLKAIEALGDGDFRKEKVYFMEQLKINS